MRGMEECRYSIEKPILYQLPHPDTDTHKTNLGEPGAPHEVIELSNGVLFRQALQVFQQVLVLQLKEGPVGGVL